MERLQQIELGLEKLGLTVHTNQVEQFNVCIEQLIKWNKAYNLTAIRDPDQMLVLHLFDSLSIAPWLKPGQLLDVGTGPGFPGIPLAILQPERSFSLLDSNGKKTRYMKQLVYQLKLDNVTVLDTRVEQWQPERQFDVIVSRAFASLDKMISLTQHLLSPTGYWQAMKGEDIETERQALPASVEVVESRSLSVPDLQASRHLITLKKRC